MIHTVAQTGSTNADLAAWLAAGELLTEGFWLRAESQTGGRGRLGRTWASPPGNLHCSTVVHLGNGDPPPHALSFVAGLAAYDALRSAGVIAGLQLKWPNDVLVHGAKIAGILSERAGKHVIVGIGANIASAPELPDRPTVALADIDTRRQIDAEHLLDLLASSFASRLSQLRREGIAAILADWTAVAHPPGTPVAVSLDARQRLSGTFAGLDPDGALRLALADGTIRAIHAGDVSLQFPG